MAKTRMRLNGVGVARSKLDLKRYAPTFHDLHKKTSTHIKQNAKARAPRDRGRLFDSIRSEVDTSALPGFSVVFTEQPHAKEMEYGTGSNFDGDNPADRKPARPQVTPQLNSWATRHGFSSGSDVANIIERKGGLMPRAYMRQALVKSRNYIRRQVKNATKRIETIWGK